MGEAAREPDELDDLYREIILDHYRCPHNKMAPGATDLTCSDRNPICGDELTLGIEMQGPCIRRVCFEGRGCSISMASASMMTDVVKDKNVEEAKDWIRTVKDLMKGVGRKSDDELGDIEALKGVAKFPVRVKCALLCWSVLEKALARQDGTRPAHGEEKGR
ncbi:MAG: SUF system NifU family Fe-S cluster assembly protein [Nitrospirae bacterium]|nr:SUF system NifU family Fe-S cluster assembly protein [Nitrospirota bacterium]